MTDLVFELLDSALVNDIAGETGFEFHALPFDGATVSNQEWHVAWHPAYQRAGVVFVGSGSSGQTIWTDATSPDDAVRRVVDDEVRN